MLKIQLCITTINYFLKYIHNISLLYSNILLFFISNQIKAFLVSIITTFKNVKKHTNAKPLNGAVYTHTHTHTHTKLFFLFCSDKKRHQMFFSPRPLFLFSQQAFCGKYPECH